MPGLHGDVLRHRELASDGLHLLGALDPGSALSHLVRYARSGTSADFGAPSTDGLPVVPVIADDPGTTTVEGIQDLSPTLSADCRSLYFLRYSRNSDTSRLFQNIFAAQR